MTDRNRPPLDFDQAIARILLIGTYLSMALIGIGVILMVEAGISPLDPAPPFDPARLASEIASGRPEGFLWLGIIAVIATPSARVAASLVGYLADGERTMALISVGILAVIALSVALAVGLGG